MKSKQLLFLFAVLMIGVSPLSLSKASAAVAIQSFTTGGSFGGFSSDETVGWRFTVMGGGVSVTSLGWFDSSLGSPLAAAHPVGIWNLSGDLFASVIVPVDGNLIGSFRYADLLTPLILAPGDYVIGGRDTTSDGDSYTSSNSSLVMGTDISFVQAAVSVVGSGFSFPGTFANNSGGRFGPNFVYTPVPESSTAVLGLLAGITLLRRRR